MVPHGLAAELVAAAAAGGGLVVGTVSAEGEPRAARGWAVGPGAGADDRVRVLMSADDPVAVENLANGRAAVTVADVRTLRSLQLKGRVVAVEDPSADDVEQMRAHSDRFLDAVHETDGNPMDALRRMLPHEVVAFEMVVESGFDQTPGPEAGAPRATGTA